MDPEDEDELLLTDEVKQDEPDEQPEPNEDEQQDEPVGFSFEGEDGEPEQAPEETPLIKQLRQKLREAERRARRVEAEQPAPPNLDPGQRPTWGEFGEEWDYDQKRYDAAVDEWIEKRDAFKIQQAEQARQQEETNREGNQIVQAYAKRVQALKVDNYQDLQDTVADELGDQAINLLVAALPEAERLIAALANDPKRLKALSGVKGNLGRLVHDATLMSREVKVATKRKAPAPDAPVRSNASGNGDATLARLEKEAERTGDRSAVIAYKRRNA